MKAGWIVLGVIGIGMFAVAFGPKQESAPVVRSAVAASPAEPDRNTIKAALVLVAAAKAGADHCNLKDGGGWNAALDYLETKPMSERKDLGEALMIGYGSTVGTFAKSPYSDTRKCDYAKEWLSKATTARDLLMTWRRH